MNISSILLTIIQGLVMFTYCITSLILLKNSENIRLKLRINWIELLRHLDHVYLFIDLIKLFRNLKLMLCNHLYNSWSHGDYLDKVGHMASSCSPSQHLTNFSTLHCFERLTTTPQDILLQLFGLGVYISRFRPDWRKIMNQPKVFGLAKNEPYQFNMQGSTQSKKSGLTRVRLASWVSFFIFP